MKKRHNKPHVNRRQPNGGCEITIFAKSGPLPEKISLSKDGSIET